MIEDSAQGVEAAKRAGMRCIGAGPLYETLDAGVTLRTLADAEPELLERHSGGVILGGSIAIYSHMAARLYSCTSSHSTTRRECAAFSALSLITNSRSAKS